MTAVLQDIWSGALDKIRESVGPRRFYLWFRETELLSTESGVFHIGVPSRFVAEWLDEHLTEAVHKALSETADACESVRFVVSPKLFRKVRAEQIEAQQELLEEVTLGKPARDTSDGQNYSLTSFVVGHCNRLAYAAARQVAVFAVLDDRTVEHGDILHRALADARVGDPVAAQDGGANEITVRHSP